MSETKLFRKKADKNKAPSTNSSRRKFLKGAVVTGGGAAALGVSQIGVAQDAGAPKKITTMFAPCRRRCTGVISARF